MVCPQASLLIRLCGMLGRTGLGQFALQCKGFGSLRGLKYERVFGRMSGCSQQVLTPSVP